MLELEFSATDLANTNLAYSPLLEAVGSLRVLHAANGEPMFAPWVEEAWPRIQDLADLALLRAVVPCGSYLPDFITPPPATPRPALKAELKTLVATDPDIVRRDLEMVYPHGLPDILVPIAREPRAGLRRIADALLAYWDCALAASWPRMADVLENDILHRGRELALGGAARLFGDIHPTVRWNGKTLLVEREASYCIDLGGAGMLLVPGVFAWPCILTITEPPLRPTLIYPARGVATLWTDPPHLGQPPQNLARLMGAQRAALLTSLTSPATTSELARRMAMTAGGVSQHLAVLRDAGLVRSSRSGRLVLYVRTPLGENLAAARA